MAKKLIALLLVAVMAFALAACGEPQVVTETVTEYVTEEISEEEYAAWAEANGYVKLAPELEASATSKKAGVNYGAIDWTKELQEAAVREYLKGTPCVEDPAYAQDETGWSYRNMFQMATCYNNVPNNTNLELVLDAESLNLLGLSENGTSKIQEFTANPEVCIAWSRQIRDDEAEAGYDYFSSYGLSFYGTVKLYSAADLESEEGQDALINVFDKYYVTNGWAAYYGKWAEAAAAGDEAAIREGKLAYIGNLVNSGAYVIYEIIPSKIVLTSPYMLNLVPQKTNAMKYTTVQDGDDKYDYILGISDEFIDSVIAYKNEYLAANQAAVEEYYTTTPMFQQLDMYSAQYGLPTSLDVALMDNNCAGMMTQTVWTAE